MQQKLRRFISSNLLNIRGWNTKRKIIVFESDDWGSIRMPSKKTYNFFLKNGIPIDRSYYNKVDALESENDLSLLFETLSKFIDKNKNPPVFTANTVLANPDFDKIRESGFQKYHYELFTETYKRYPQHQNCFKLIQEGINEGLYHPQFHGREHVNVNFWIRLLRDNNSDFKLAFDHDFWGLSRDIFPEMRRNIQASFDMESVKELKFQKKSIEEGLNIFEKLFGFRSKSFIANNFIWDCRLNKILKICGVEYIQCMKYQKYPLFKGNSERKYERHYLGKKNKWDQYYLIRNCVFEPSLNNNNYENVDACLNSIRNAFFWNKPAIITSHRLNYIGFIDPVNRDKNLHMLEKLLSIIIRKWPDIEFMTSDQLGELIRNDSENK